MSRPRGRVRAPELAGRGGWINAPSSSPDGLSLAALRGKAVLLDFWTFCCINCLHVLEELRPLEERFGDALVVVGVHSPKFDHERDRKALELAVARHGVRHPVLNDPDRATWTQYGVRAWPTLVLVDPEGYAVAAFEGEGNAGHIERAIGPMIEDSRAAGTLDETPLSMLLPLVRSGALRFPGKVAAGLGGLIAVSDSGHDRVVIARLAGEGAEVIAVAGSGRRGMEDGRFAGAAFKDPQGLLFLGAETLLVADTGNHAVRRLDLSSKTVETVAGDGRQSRPGAPGGPARRTSLNSPWDLAPWGGRIAIAMAGSHQLWVLDLAGGRVEALAGSGWEGLSDGPAPGASLAQPAGLSVESGSEERLWFVDSETSSLRVLDQGGHVSTAVGRGLFDFGYVDGSKSDALMQHPLGVLAAPRGIIVCDTYNSTLRLYDKRQEELRTFAGEGLAEPSGAALLDEDIIVADTGNHRLVRVRPGGEMRPFCVRGLLPPGPPLAEKPVAEEIGPVELAGEVELQATMRLPEGERLDGSFGPPVRLIVSGELSGTEPLVISADKLPARLRLALAAEEDILDVWLRVGSCMEGEVCRLSERRWRVRARRDAEGSPRLNLGVSSGRPG